MNTDTGTLLRDAAILADVHTVEELRDRLELWKAAEAAVATSQSYQLAGRALTRTDAAEIRHNLLLYSRAVKLASQRTMGGGPRFVPTRFTGGLADHG